MILAENLEKNGLSHGDQANNGTVQ
ncbi:hypothetical protein CY0110_18277 [Crocosphaera chwakensis CCY0110]|uniref:Uncharacterized protein n=1 Tax=Crocosphaera chwakensis CCY0110 TaxID=391612 RepID=A3IIY7_9CHRO|nr:hypothetical protein CY0110_18277 [Crocosphaera chwakensis CCY0110]